MKIKKGDTVVITTGKDRGKKGTVERVYPKSDRLFIPTLNLYKKSVKKSESSPKGGIIDVPRPLQVANVALICPHCKKPTRVGMELSDDKKFRVCKKCNKRI